MLEPVTAALGNTPTIARKSYVHPALIALIKDGGGEPASPAPGQSRAAYTADALSALMNLGYGQGDAAQAVATVAGEAPDADTAALIRASLKLLAPKG